MRKLFILFILFSLLLLAPVFAQSAIAKYVLATKGDTLVVKDETDYGAPDALTQLLNADTVNVPSGRVYQLHNNGFYSNLTNPTSSTKRKVIVAGESNVSIKTNQNGEESPPILCGAVYEGITTLAGITCGFDLTVKNVNCNSGNSSATLGGLNYFNINGTGHKLTVDNCLIEHTLWCEVNPGSGSKVFFKNSYFVNLSGSSCRRNGGVMDFFTSQDTIFVENCTFVMTQGSLYKFRDGLQVNRVLFNHNDFINCAGYVFMNRGVVSNISITNNIFINCNVQCYAPILNHLDRGETDPGSQPMGLVNLCPDSALFKAAGGGHSYVDKNLVYWDPQFANIPAILNTNKTDGATNWVSQAITMNERTQAAFSNIANWYLVQGIWIKQLPTFKKTASLFTTQLKNLVTYVSNCSDSTYSYPLPYWREFYVGVIFIYSDWPIPIDLSYTDASLLTAGLNHFPVGDLNWFPTQYTAWLAQRSSELNLITYILHSGKGGESVKQLAGFPVSYQLDQNYPNPFNPTTVINYSIPKAGYVTLKVYNLLGQEIATLVNGYQAPSKYQVSFDASKLASGIYLYKITAGNFTQSKKMMLIR